MKYLLFFSFFVVLKYVYLFIFLRKFCIYACGCERCALILVRCV